MYHKHDLISIHRNPLKEYSKPLESNYQPTKFHQIKIYFKCEKQKSLDF